MTVSTEFFTVTKEQLPSKAYELTFRRPLYKDRREAMRRIMPMGQNANSRDIYDALGYGFEELLIAMCLEKVDGQAPQQQFIKDPIDKIKVFPTADIQYLVSLFYEAFTLNPDTDAQDIRNIALELKKTQDNYFSVPASVLPSGSDLTVNFGAPNQASHVDAYRLWKPELGCDQSELIFASCLTHINRNPVGYNRLNPLEILDTWEWIDVQFVLGVFVSMFYLETETREEAKSLGKQLRKKGSVSTTLSPKEDKPSKKD